MLNVPTGFCASAGYMSDHKNDWKVFLWRQQYPAFTVSSVFGGQCNSTLAILRRPFTYHNLPHVNIDIKETISENRNSGDRCGSSAYPNLKSLLEPNFDDEWTNGSSQRNGDMNFEFITACEHERYTVARLFMRFRNSISSTHTQHNTTPLSAGNRRILLLHTHFDYNRAPTYYYASTGTVYVCFCTHRQ